MPDPNRGLDCGAAARGMIVTGLLLALVFSGGPLYAAPPKSAHRRPHKVSCAQMREAVAAGHTLEQIIAEFDTDAAQVMKCTQKRGRRRGASTVPKTKSSKRTAKSRKEKGAASPRGGTPSQPQERRRSTLRLSPRPLP